MTKGIIICFLKQGRISPANQKYPKDKMPYLGGLGLLLLNSALLLHT